MVPEISVLLPMYNAEATLETCLRSLTRQSLASWECVLVDDGSSDRSRALARRIAAGDDRFRLIEAEHRGLVDSLNLGLEHCRAAIVARMDADDWMHRDRLSLQLRALREAPQLAAVGTQVRIFPRIAWGAEAERSLPGESAQTRKGRGGYETWLNGISSPDDVMRESYIECPIAHPSLAIRREVLDSYRYRDKNWPEDYDLVLRLLTAGQKLAVIPRRLLAWRDHENRLSRTSPRYALERFVACKAHHLSQSLLRGRKDYVLWGYGSTGRMLANALAKLDLAPSHIVEVHPRRIGQRIRDAEVIPPAELAFLPRKPVVASVAGAGARREIRAALTRLKYREGHDFVCAA
ncbi:MAG: glycosyltransferase family 2 protein [Deltaproteobacteria bacterium]|nr:glycosyltransferase family 2 protein [Deltaproteobacteria bacterium]